MSDITANVVVSMPNQLFTLASSFKAASSGKIYIGQIDTDPVNPANQIQVYLENEDGSHVPAAQPIIINAGGYPVYNGQIAKFVTIQGHSMAVYDAYNIQQFYFPNVLRYGPDQLRRALSEYDGLKLVGRCPDIATLRTIEPTDREQRIDVVEYASGNEIGGGYFHYDSTDTTTADNGVTVIVTAGGKRWKRKFTGAVKAEWAGCLGDGSIDETNNLKKAFAACTNGESVELTRSGIYRVSSAVSGGSCSGVVGNYSTIRVDNPSATMTALSFGTVKGSLPNLSIAVVQQQRMITISGIASIAAPGDLISMSSSDIRVSTNEATGVRAYNHGMRAVITSIVGDIVTLDRAFYAAFTVNGATVNRGFSKMVLTDLVIDATTVPSVSFLVNAVRFTGTNINISGVRIAGSEYCATGINLIGSVASIAGSNIVGFKNKNGVESGGRTGYGIYIDCHDTVVSSTHISDCKHNLSCASRDYVMEGLLVQGCGGHFSELACFDLHANVGGTPVFTGNTINATGAGFGVRNGSARIANNYIFSQRSGDATPAVIGVDEYPNVYGLHIENNYFNCSNNLRLISFSSFDAISNVNITNNTGTIGSLVNQQMNNRVVSGFNISNNNFSGMTKVFEMSKRGPASPLVLLELIEKLTISDNNFDVNNVLGDPPIHIWCPATIASESKLELRNTLIENNYINSTDTPIRFKYLNITSNLFVDKLRLNHTVSANLVKPPTQHSLSFENCSISKATISEVQAPGCVYIAGVATQSVTGLEYASEVLVNQVRFNGLFMTSIQFVDSRVDIASKMQFTLCSISDCDLNNPYGSTINIGSGRLSVGWDGGGIFDIRGNRLSPTSGFAISIGQGYTGNKISMRNNLMTSTISNLSGTTYLDTGNNVVS
ncbi:phage tailspike protein [Raoultella terrigena]|uniref:phage tailspike protein n=1 Tax=Raoultella terrigena TaxID=577 RepID=UPI001F2331D9|nr:phage tailspike protein [Raoultella terrigena]MCE9899650.1 phage tailspike protein [Raoultella terrigena]